MTIIDEKKLEKKILEREAFKRLNKHITVLFMDKGDDLGYTSADKIIHLAWQHQIMQDLKMSDDEARLFRRGVFAHELLHQLLTNFKYTNAICKDMTPMETKIFMTFANTLEDPAIEFFAPQCLSNDLCEALKYSIMSIYIASPGIEESQSPFGQLVNALIHFGDMGIVKGEFTFPDAGEMFLKLAPLYNEGIECPDNKRRLDIAKECMEISKPLWEPQMKAEEDFQQFLEELLDFLQQLDMDPADLGASQKSVMSSSGSSNSASQNRKNALSNASGSSEISDDNKNNKENSDEDGNASDGGSKEDCENDSKDESKGESENAQDSSASSQGSGSSDASSQAKETQIKANLSESLSAFTSSKEEAAEQAKEEMGQTEQAIKRAKQSLEKEEKSSVDDFTRTVTDAAEKIESRNSIISGDRTSQSAYASLVTRCGCEITSLSKALKTLFEQDTDEYVPHTSGRYNVLRGEMATSAKMFDKKRLPSNISDIEICLVIDNSGSMSGDRIACARICACTIVEACKKVGIPCYIMGFTNRSHSHFSSWNYNRAQVSSIIKMSAGGGTDDATAVRFATELFNKRNAEHKLLIVISDGFGSDLLKEAVNIARRTTTVFAVGVGEDIPVSWFKEVYKEDFVHIVNPNGMSKTISKKIKKIVRKAVH